MERRSSSPSLHPRDQIGVFLDQWSLLRQTRLAKEGYPNAVSIKASVGQPMWVHTRQPDEEFLRSFLVVFRPFTAPRDEVCLYRVYNTCQKLLLSDHLRDCLRQSRQLWAQMHKNMGVQIEVNNMPWTPEYILDLWINGWYFHTDQEKRRQLQQLFAPARELVRMEFLGFLGEGMRQVLYTGNVACVAMKEGLFRFPS